MSIFQKPNGVVHYYDQITIGGRTFDAAIITQTKRGDPSAIHCGRIVTIEMTCEDDMVAYFDDGQWYSYPDDDFGEAGLALQLLITEWSKDKPKPFINRGKIEYGYFERRYERNNGKRKEMRQVREVLRPLGTDWINGAIQ